MSSRARLLLCLALAAAPVSAAGVEAQQPVPATRPPRFVAAEDQQEVDPAGAPVLLRRVALALVNMPVEAAIEELALRAKLEIIYASAQLPPGKRVTIRGRELTVREALTEMLTGTGLDVVVYRDGGLGLAPGRPAAVPTSGAIAGRVWDQTTSAPIAGAIVTVEGTDRTAATNNEGRYRIKALAPGTYTVRGRYIGYTPQTTLVAVGAGETVTVDFVLEGVPQRMEDLVTVTPGGMQTRMRAVPAPITVITAADIEQQQPQTLNDIFRQMVPSAVAFDVPANPQTTALSLRGQSTLAGGGQVKIFLDRAEAATSTTFPVDPTSIERIEVIRGPQAATLYGPDAADGVIQIFTKRGSPGRSDPQLVARAEAGVQQTPYPGFKGVVRQSYSASVRGGGTDASYNAGASYRRLPDWVPDGELSSQSVPSVFGGVHYSRGIVNIDLSGRYHVVNTHLVNNPLLLRTAFPPLSRPSFTPTTFTNQTASAQLTVIPTLWWQNRLTVGIEQFSGRTAQDRPRLTTPDDTLLQIAEIHFSKAGVGYNTSVHWNPSTGVSTSLTAGVDYYRLLSSRFLTTRALRVEGDITTFPAGAFSVGRDVVTNTGYFSQVEVGVQERLFLTAGLRADENSTLGEDASTPLSPRVGLAYVHEVGGVTVKARGSYGQAIRAPRPGQAFESVVATQITLANPQLAPERQRGWDAGFDLVFGSRGSLQVTGYDQTAEDLILQVRVATQPLPTFQFRNVGRVRNRGVEIEGTLTLGSRLRVRGQYAYVHSRITDLGPDFQGDDRVGDRPRGVPAHTGGGTVTLTPRRGTSLTGGVTYVGTFRQQDPLAQFTCNGGTGPCRPTTRDYIVDYPGFVKVNATLSQQIMPAVSGFISVDNLTNNRSYEGFTTQPVMGRLTSVGLQLRY